MGGYNLLIYSFRKISFFNSKKKDYVNNILEENEEEERKRKNRIEKVNTKKKVKDMSYEEFVHAKKDKWGSTNELFAASISLVLLSFVVGLILIK